jgi:uncharacterized membrane protein YraQ (UPF0718 family)
MLASPVLNPIVLASTWVAYSGRGTAVEMVLGRAGAGVLLAVLVGITFSRVAGQALLRPAAADPRADAGCTVGGERLCASAPSGRAASFVQHLTGDFLFMGKFIVLGAAAAAILQTLVSQSLVDGVAGAALLAPLALIGLAFMLSLCSEADAFVAVSLTSFTPGAQLAFLVFGPMMDAKLALLYGAAFRRRFALRLILIAVPFLVLTSLLFDLLVR